MLVRHCVESSNVNAQSFIVDPLKIRHVTLKERKIDDMSSFVDPMTHLNLDFPNHKVDMCIVSEKLEKGAKIKYSDQGFIFAAVPKTAFKHLGPVDYTQRLLDMRESIREIRQQKTKDEKK
jgi:hypothetical protein